MHDAPGLPALLAYELAQRRESGYDVAGLEAAVKLAVGDGSALGEHTILGLNILEAHGFGSGTQDVAAEWLDHLPFTKTYTAERVAYRNLVLGLQPPETAPTATRTGSGSARRSALTCGAAAMSSGRVARLFW
jgi:hypothetical protein